MIRICRIRPMLYSIAPLVACALLFSCARAEPPAAPGAVASTRTTALHTRTTSTIALTVASAANGKENAVLLLATVDGKPGATPGGSVVFTIQGKPVGEAAVANGSASLTVGALPAGLSSLAASYKGDGNFLPSKSATVRFDNDDREWLHSADF